MHRKTRSQMAMSLQDHPVFRQRSSTEPPIYRVDLSAPPRQRYAEICRDYKGLIMALLPLYDQILALAPFPRLANWAAKLLLRRLHSREETEEIMGIVDVTGVPKHLVIAYNTFLDLFSGCVSGGARIRDTGQNGKTNGIVHFRNLDWEMEPLRSMLICVEYVRDGEVVARGVTYAGYTGVLTGVRENLSLSLNYRTTMNSPSSTRSHRVHQLLLLLGRRPSISSRLRQILLSPSPPSLASLTGDVTTMPTSPCYLTFCTPSSVLVIEKDLVTATSYTSDTFLAVTNHDLITEQWSSERWKSAIEQDGKDIGGVRAILEDSIERKGCVCDLWTAANSKGAANVKIRDVVGWLETRPVLNETTHFSCIMDPSIQGGGLLWVQAYEDPVHMGSSEEEDPTIDEFDASDG